MASLGIFVGTVGTDAISGMERFTLNIPILVDGIGLLPVAMGLFGIGEVLVNVELTLKADVFETSLKRLLPNLDDWKRSIMPILRGSVIGFFLGILPGGGGLISSFASYTTEVKLSKHPEEFGKGAIEGVAGPETANNAGAGGAFIPLFTLGLPTNVIMALLLGAMMLHGLQPGPQMIMKHPDLFWGVVASMYIGNAMLLILNLPLIGLWVQVLKIPYHLLFPIIIFFCLVGAFSLNNNVDEITIMIIFGVLGYLFKKFSYPGAPFIMAMVLGPMMERALRQSLIMSLGSGWIFITRPISLVTLLIAFSLLASTILPAIKKKRQVLAESSDD
jgi:putative tricarboxylic transport membrane protein